MIVTVKDFTGEMKAAPINKNEVTRYCSGRSDSNFSKIIDECIAEATPFLSYKLCFAEFGVSVSDESVSFPFARAKSRDLAKNLAGFESCVIFCATVGVGIDRLITKYTTVSPVKSLVFQGIGAERIEALCDAFCKETEGNYKQIKPRFSPGYGDLDLSFQHEIFKVLQCSKKIGVTLNESLLMSPTKSVTAIIGVKK